MNKLLISGGSLVEMEAGTLLEQRVTRLELQVSELMQEKRASDAALQAEAEWYDAQIAHDAAACEQVPTQKIANRKPVAGPTMLVALIAVAVGGSIVAARAGAEQRRERWATCAATLPGVQVTDGRVIYRAEAFVRTGLHPAEEQLRPLNAAHYAVLKTADDRAFLCATPSAGRTCACAPARDEDDRVGD